MRVLLLTSIYPPDAGNAKRRSELATGLVRAGHQVTVLTPFPHYPTGIIPERYHGHLYMWEEEDGIQILRTLVIPDARKTFLIRVLNFASFLISAIVGGLLVRGRYDVFVTVSPSLLNGLAAIIICAFRRMPFVFDVQDIYPETAVALGVLRNRPMIRLMEMLERWIYRRSALVVVLSQGFAADLQAKGVSPNKLALVPNWVDTDLFQPLASDIRQQLQLNGKFIVIFSGTIGLAQGLATLVEAAGLLRENPGIHFLILGEGVQRRQLETQAQQAGLGNLTFVPLQPRSQVPLYIAAADATLVHLKRNHLYTITIPCKTYEYMAMGKPILMGVAGDAAATVTAAGCGVAVTPEDAQSLAHAVTELSRNPELVREMGRRGRQAAVADFSSTAVVAQYVRHLEEVVEKTKRK